MEENEKGVSDTKKRWKKIIFIAIGIFLLIVIILVAFMRVQYKRETLKNSQVEIEKQLTNIDKLRNEVYFNPKYNKNILNIKDSSEKAIGEKNIKELTLIQKEVTSLHNKIDYEITTYNKYYKLLKEEVSTSDKLKSDYFAKDYDISKLDEIKDKAETVIKESDYIKYEELYNELSSQNDILNTNIKKALNTIYSTPTNNEFSHEFPFAVSDIELPSTWSFEPIVKQTKNHPTWVITSEADVLEEPPYANLFIDDNSAEYYFKVNQISTKEITVQDEERKLQKALVNTEVIFDMKDGYSVDKYTALNERPAYLFKNKTGQVYLALKNYDGDDFYVLYSPN